MLALDSAAKRPPGFDGKRLHLLKVAARIFSEVGYDGASMRRIAAETDFSLAGIYHYVASKDELLYWIQYHTFDSLLRGLEKSLEGVVDPRDRLATAVRNHVRHFGENMHELKVCARELETLEGEAYDAVHERRRSYFEAVHRLVIGLQPERGTHSDSWIATANLFGMINWFYQWYDTGRSQVSLDELAARQTALFLDGYFASTSNGDDGGSK
ncbi:MAG: TetR/AcrR family transcriptional regulator [Planctomycetota bacterium]|jgi:AcrR family transcriptional regulator